MTRDISNSDDIIDSRDVIARFDELVADRNALQEAIDELIEARGDLERDEATTKLNEAADNLDEAKEALADWLSDYADELKALQDLIEEGENYADDWKYGATLIRDSYFEDYCQELVEDISDMPHGIPSYVVIDWEATARNLQVNYSSISFDGVDYWVR